MPEFLPVIRKPSTHRSLKQKEIRQIGAQDADEELHVLPATGTGNGGGQISQRNQFRWKQATRRDESKYNEADLIQMSQDRDAIRNQIYRHEQVGHTKQKREF